MKVLVCGSRDMPWHFLDLVIQTLRALEPRPTVVIEGEARGADTLGKVAAIYDGIEVQKFPADWKTYGKKAGHIRNQQMLDQNPDLVIAFHPHTGITPGTRDMVTRAQAKGTPVQIVTYPAEPPR
jgi:hypothetical protein